jgi:Fe-S-cluster containining protein
MGTGNGPDGAFGGDARLLRALDEAWDEARRRAGRHLVCRPGCTPCCIGPFPITCLDADRLAAGLRELARRDAAAAHAIVERAFRDLGAFYRGFPGDADTGDLGWGDGDSGDLGPDDDAVKAFLARHADRPCPALEPGTGLCLLYDHRPVSCRTFGPPVRIGGADLPPCELCFTGATAAEIAACRVEPDPEGLENRLLRDGRKTLIAYVLAWATIKG